MPLTEETERTITGTCPVCDAAVTPGAPVEESEIISCTECCTMLVVDGVLTDRLILGEAPQVEEDWGQ